MKDHEPSSSASTELRTLLRLLVGSAAIGSEELIRMLKEWEIALETLRNQPPATDEASDSQTEKFKPAAPPAVEDTATLLRYALIGWLMENEKHLQRGLRRTGRLSRAVANFAEPWLRPWKKSPLLTPLRRQTEALQARGRQEVKRWIALGRAEELHSRDLTRLALKQTVDQNISYLAHNPEVEQLVQTQSTGLANEVVEEVRERTVSADTFLEGLVRSVMRRLPREKLPEPPPEVQKTAAGLRPRKKKGPSSLP